MDKLINELWKRLESVFNSFANQLKTEYADHHFFIGHSRNNAFPLRAYLTVLSRKDSDELSITVDIRILDRQLVIESDISGEDGAIHVQGPSLVLTDVFSDPSTQAKVNDWINAFERMLSENLTKIKAAVDDLS